MSAYSEHIVKATGCTTEETPLVEGYMRLTFHTLDGLSRQRFNAEAKSCLKDVRADPKSARENAESYGLLPKPA